MEKCHLIDRGTIWGKRPHDEVYIVPRSFGFSHFRWISVDEENKYRGRCRSSEAGFHEGWHHGWQWDPGLGTAACEEGCEGLSDCLDVRAKCGRTGGLQAQGTENRLQKVWCMSNARMPTPPATSLSPSSLYIPFQKSLCTVSTLQLLCMSNVCACKVTQGQESECACPLQSREGIL